MKLTIKDVKKNYDNYTMKNGGTIYAVWAQIEIDGKGFPAKVQSFTPKLELKNGFVYTTGENCDRIKIEDTSFQKQTGETVEYKKVSIYALKSEKDFKKGGYERMTEELFFDSVDKCWRKAEEIVNNIIGSAQLPLDTMALDVMQKVFSTIQINYCDHVKPQSKIDSAADKVKNAVNGNEVIVEDNPFSDDDVPF